MAYETFYLFCLSASKTVCCIHPAGLLMVDLFPAQVHKCSRNIYQHRCNCLEKPPLGPFESQNSSGCSLHTATQNSREKVTECPILLLLFACWPTLSSGDTAYGRAPSSQGALQDPWTDPCHCVLFGQEWRTPAIWSRAMLWYKEPLKQGAWVCIGRSWLLTFRAKHYCKNKTNRKKAMSLAEDKLSKANSILLKCKY